MTTHKNIVSAEPGDFFAPAQLKWKRKRSGFMVVNTRTGEELSGRFSRRAAALQISADLNRRGIPAGVRTLERTGA